MFINYDISEYIVHDEDTLLNTLKKLNSVKGRIKFIIDSNNCCTGSVTNGDINRWLIKKANPDLSTPIKEVANKNFSYVLEGSSQDKIESLLNNFLFVPILDKKMHLTGVALRNLPREGFKVGDSFIGETAPCMIIAEIGNNHNGCFEKAKVLVNKSADSGANCAKFQMRQLDDLYINSKRSINHSKLPENLGTEYTKDLLKKVQLSNDELFKIFDYCKELGITPLCTPWDLSSLNLLNDYGLSAFKFASADLTNHPLILEGIKTKKPLFISTGMSVENEIISVVNLLNEYGTSFCLLHCNSTYPASFDSLNLNYLKHLKEISARPVGYSGHERGINASLAAVALGAKIVEKHITLDKNLEGPDHQVSLLPHEFRLLVDGIREVEQSLGHSNLRQIGQGEMMNRTNLAKSIFLKLDLKKGDIISEDQVTIKSPGNGLQPCYLSELLGKPAKRDMSTGECFYPSDLNQDIIEPRGFRFKRPWGLPVRFHDYTSLTNGISPDFVEFHLSYRDLNIDFKSILSSNAFSDFVIHCPELFSEDHILDLASENDTYREHSINELRRVIAMTLEMKRYFGIHHSVRIVVNVGGFSMHKFLCLKEKRACYNRLEKSLNELDLLGVELIPQTMPPFPWHFGGQRFHNLFVYPEEIVEFCDKNKMRICLDLSHSKLACTHSKNSFYKFCELVAPYSTHLHIADSKGNDGEGLQIGEGDIDFKSISEILNLHCPKASFIPEIWQGHENNGEGFWVALDRLEDWL